MTPWRQARERRAAGEGQVPQRLVGADLAELEGDAAKHQRQQHHDHRQIERRHDDGIGQRERHQQAAAAHHQPGLVAVPERRDRRHHLVALGVVLGERKQHADAEVEAVEDDVQHDCGADDAGPDQRKKPFGCHAPASRVLACGGERAAKPDGRFVGRCGVEAFHDQPVDEIDAGRKDDAVDHDEQREGHGNGGADHRRGGVGGAQDALHDPGLTAALGHHPAGDHRDETHPPGLRHHQQIPARLEQFSAPPQERADKSPPPP